MDIASRFHLERGRSSREAASSATLPMTPPEELGIHRIASDNYAASKSRPVTALCSVSQLLYPIL